MLERVSPWLAAVRRRPWTMLCAVGLALLMVGLVAHAAAPRGRGGPGSGGPSSAALGSSAGGGPGAAAATSPTPHASPSVAPTSGKGGGSAAPAPPPPLRCSVHVGEGDKDDSVEMELTCIVNQSAAQSDTSFTLHFGILDPIGHLHPFSQACAGKLRKGSGSCSQTYTFILPYAANPGPVSGQSLPSHHALGPVTPVNR